MSCQVGIDFPCIGPYFRTLLSVVGDVEMGELECHVGCKGQKDRIRCVGVGWNGRFEGEASDGLADERCRSANEEGFLKHERVSLEKNEIKK